MGRPRESVSRTFERALLPRLALASLALSSVLIRCVPEGRRAGSLRVGQRAEDGATTRGTTESFEDGTVATGDSGDVTPPGDSGTASRDAGGGGSPVDSGASRDGGTPPSDAGAPRDADEIPDDAFSFPDARPTPDASPPMPVDCPNAPGPLSGGSSGPINLAQVQGHGLPGCYRCGLDVADFDGDGRVDVVMAGSFDNVFVSPAAGSDYNFNNRVRLYRNVTCPGEEIRFAFQQEMPGMVGGGGALVVVGDYNGDGFADFAAQIREGDPPGSDASAFLNHGGWSFSRHSIGTFDTQSTSLGMTKADIDQDGSDDLIFNSDAHGAAPGLWYRWNGSGFQGQQTSYPHRITYGGTITAGDLDGDGFPDIAVGGNSDVPFGSYDCSSTLLYAEIHFNKGAVLPRGLQSSGLSLGRFAMRANRNNPPFCNGMDNASMLIADMDNDGTNDIVIAGSADAFPGPPPGPPQSNGSHYDFAVLFNRDGSGANFIAFENAGVQYPNGTTNGGTGNLDNPNIAVGDLNGDGLPEAFIQGHHRDYANDPGRYIFDTRLFLNVAGTSFTEIDIGLPEVGEGGQAMADFNNDGKIDLVFAGATIPFHSNGNNPDDFNNTSTIFAYVYRNTRP